MNQTYQIDQTDQIDQTNQRNEIYLTRKQRSLSRSLYPASRIKETSEVKGVPKDPLLIVPLTSKLKAADFPFTFLIEPDQFNNLDVASVALVFQLRAIDKRRLKSRIGKIEKAKTEL